MGNIISTLLLKYFLKRKCSLLINNEGNICSSDAGIITRKTLSYSEHYFANYGFKNLIIEFFEEGSFPRILYFICNKIN